MGISRRLPSWRELAPVYAVIVILIYGWTILWFFWKLPSWLSFLNAGEILTVLAYALSTNLVESIAALCVPIFLALILPTSWFHDTFVARGAAMMLTGIGALMFAAYQFKNRDELPSLVVGGWQPALILLGISAAVFAAGRVGVLRRALEALGDRATIFIYISLPASLLSLLYVAARWLR